MINFQINKKQQKQLFKKFDFSNSAKGLKRHLKPLFFNLFLDTGPYDFSVFKKNDKFIFYDLGSNLGIVSIFVALNFPNAKIIAIEPSLEIFDSLVKNVANFNFQKRIYCINKAIYDESNKVIDFFSLHKKMHNDSSIDANFNNVYRNSNIRKIKPKNIEKVETISLKDLLKKYSDPLFLNYLKIDIEGAEYKAFEKFKEFSLIDKLSIELHDSKAKQIDFLAFLLKNLNQDQINVEFCYKIFRKTIVFSLKFNDFKDIKSL